MVILYHHNSDYANKIDLTPTPYSDPHILIGSIIATEFAMALEYKNNFVKNALVFAPGKTILGALKEISDIPFEKVIPPRLYKPFISSVKITYTQDKEKGIPIIRGSSFNIIVTNTEKIRIQKPTGKSVQFNLLNYKAGMNREDIIESVKQAVGHQFDPKVVRAFLEVMAQEDREGGI